MYEFLIGVINGFLATFGVEIDIAKAKGEFIKDLAKESVKIYNELDD